jgi:hypothetical protein
MDKVFIVHEDQTEYLYTRRTTIKTKLLFGDTSNSLENYCASVALTVNLRVLLLFWETLTYTEEMERIFFGT